MIIEEESEMLYKRKEAQRLREKAEQNKESG